MRPRGGQRRFQNLTTASDTLTTLDRTYRNDLVLGGNGVLQVYDLGDATTYQLGRAHFIFYNNTPEFVGVRNSDNSVWHRVPPRARCVCVLQNNAAPAGVWWSQIAEADGPAGGLSDFIDYIGTTTSSTSGLVTGELGGQLMSGGVNALVSVSGINTVPGRIGILRCATGTTTTGYAGVYHPGLNSGGYCYVTGGARAVEYSQCLDALSVVAQEYILRLGIGNNITGGAHTRGVHWVYDRLTWGDVWVMRCINAGGNTSVATAVAPAADATGGTWQKLRLEVSSAAARADFWINNVQVSALGGITTNIPASTDVLYFPVHGITKSAGTTAAVWRNDYTALGFHSATLR